MLCGWGVKAGIICVWVAGRTVLSLCVVPKLILPISEHFRDVFIIRCYTNAHYLLAIVRSFSVCMVGA